MANQRVVFFTDNAALVDIINKQSSKHKLIMAPLCPLILCCLRHNIFFKTIETFLADSSYYSEKTKCFILDKVKRMIDLA